MRALIQVEKVHIFNFKKDKGLFDPSWEGKGVSMNKNNSGTYLIPVDKSGGQFDLFPISVLPKGLACSIFRIIRAYLISIEKEKDLYVQKKKKKLQDLFDPQW